MMRSVSGESCARSLRLFGEEPFDYLQLRTKQHEGQHEDEPTLKEVKETSGGVRAEEMAFVPSPD